MMRAVSRGQKLWQKSPISWCRCFSSAPLPDARINYPPVKPKYPPGENWEGLDPKYAWKYYEEAERVKALPTVLEKLKHIRFSNLWKHTLMLYPWQHIPKEGCEYVKYATKTQTIDSLPSEWMAGVNEDLIDLLYPVVQQTLIAELGVSHTDARMKRKASIRCLKQFFMLITAMGNSHNPQLHTSRIAGDVKVRSYYMRFGWDGERIRGKAPTALPMMRIQSLVRNTLQLQNELPLPQVVDQDSEQVLESPAPEFEYRPRVAGQFNTKEAAEIHPGYWVSDRCPHTPISLQLPFTEQEKALRDYSDQPKALENLNHAAAIVSAFSSLTAQSAYQGFTYLNEITHPFVQQTFMMDGRGQFRLYVYQLNTVQLHKPDAANRRKNICWCSPAHQLWNDETLELSRESLSLFVQAFMKQGVAQHNPRPYLREADAREVLINDRDPEKPKETRDRIHRYLNT